MLIDVLDVGHGACTVIRSETTTVVLDVGSFARLGSYLREHGLSRIDAVIVTHLDADHCRGLSALLGLRDVEVGRVFINPDFFAWSAERTRRERCIEESACDCGGSPGGRCTLAARVLRQVEFRSRQMAGFARPLYLHDVVRVGDIEAYVLWPEYTVSLHPCTLREALSREVDRNLLSAAVRFDIPGARTVVAGDVPIDAIRRSALAGAEWATDVLVYPHHGGRLDDGVDRGVDRELQELTTPKHVVFQVGRGRYGLPRREAVEAFRNQSRILCTGLSEKCCEESADGSAMCAGSVRVEVGGRVLTERRRHREFVASDPQLDPMCVVRPRTPSAE